MPRPLGEKQDSQLTEGEGNHWKHPDNLKSKQYLHGNNQQRPDGGEAKIDLSWGRIAQTKSDEIWNGLKCHHARHSLLAGVVVIPFIRNVRFVWQSTVAPTDDLITISYDLSSLSWTPLTAVSFSCKTSGLITCVEIWELVQSIPKSSSHKVRHWHHLILFWLSSSQTKPAIRIVDWLNNQEMKFIVQLSEDTVQWLTISVKEQRWTNYATWIVMTPFWGCLPKSLRVSAKKTNTKWLSKLHKSTISSLLEPHAELRNAKEGVVSHSENKVYITGSFMSCICKQIKTTFDFHVIAVSVFTLHLLSDL